PGTKRVMRREKERDARIRASDFFNNYGKAQRVETSPAVVLRNHDTEKPQVGHFRNQLAGKTRRLITFAGAGRNFCLGEITDGLLQQILLSRQLKIHCRFKILRLPGRSSPRKRVSRLIQIASATPRLDSRLRKNDNKPMRPSLNSVQIVLLQIGQSRPAMRPEDIFASLRVFSPPADLPDERSPAPPPPPRP